MMQLVEGCSRDHAPDFAERSVATDAFVVCAQSQPNSAAAPLDGLRQRAIVDDFAADCRQAADFVQRFWADQNAAARCSGGLLPVRCDPAWRVKHEEEEYESRYKGFLRRCFASQAHHVGDEVARPRLRYSHQFRHGVLSMPNI